MRLVPVICINCKAEPRFMKEVTAADDINYYFFCGCKKTPRYGSLALAVERWETHWHKIKPEDMPALKEAEPSRRAGYTGLVGN